MVKPKLLDLCCGIGGATKGYQRAGFEVIGVDIKTRSNYCGDEFYQMDVLEAISKLKRGAVQAVHASPPCQASCTMSKGTNSRKRHIQLIPEVRDALAGLDVPTVIENVQGAIMRKDVVLCGEMFSLDVIRHRYFEVEGFDCPQPEHIPHRGKVKGWRHGVYQDGPYYAVYGTVGGGKGNAQQWAKAMGIDWTISAAGITEAIPPAYTEYIGRSLIAVC